MRRLTPASVCGCGLDSLHGHPWRVCLPVVPVEIKGPDHVLAHELARGITRLIRAIAREAQEPSRSELGSTRKGGNDA